MQYARRQKKYAPGKKFLATKELPTLSEKLDPNSPYYDPEWIKRYRPELAQPPQPQPEPPPDAPKLQTQVKITYPEGYTPPPPQPKRAEKRAWHEAIVANRKKSA